MRWCKNYWIEIHTIKTNDRLIDTCYFLIKLISVFPQKDADSIKKFLQFKKNPHIEDTTDHLYSEGNIWLV